MTGFSEGSALGDHENLGAYLLGGLSEADRSAFEGHLAACAECRRELARLSGLPARLDGLSAREANRFMAEDALVPETSVVDPPDYPTDDPTKAAGKHGRGTLSVVAPAVAVRVQPGERMLERLHERRRRAHRRTLALAASIAVVGAAAGAAGGYLAAARPGPALPAPDASYAMDSTRGVEARVDLEKKAWGTEVTLRASHLPTSGRLELWVLDSTGNADRAGSWSATATGVSAITGAVPVHLPTIKRVQVRSGAHLVLAEARLPAAGADAPGDADGFGAAGAAEGVGTGAARGADGAVGAGTTTG